MAVTDVNMTDPPPISTTAMEVDISLAPMVRVQVRDMHPDSALRGALGTVRQRVKSKKARDDEPWNVAMDPDRKVRRILGTYLQSIGVSTATRGAPRGNRNAAGNRGGSGAPQGHTYAVGNSGGAAPAGNVNAAGYRQELIDATKLLQRETGYLHGISDIEKFVEEMPDPPSRHTAVNRLRDRLLPENLPLPSVDNYTTCCALCDIPKDPAAMWNQCTPPYRRHQNPASGNHLSLQVRLAATDSVQSSS